MTVQILARKPAQSVSRTEDFIAHSSNSIKLESFLENISILVLLIKTHAGAEVSELPVHRLLPVPIFNQNESSQVNFI